MILLLRSATDRQLQALLQAPERLEDFLDDEEDFGDAEGARFLELDADRSWHGIHYLLTGTATEGTAPLDFLERGGKEVGDVDFGYGPARALSAAEVQAVHAALAPLTPEALAPRFDPERMRMLEIYPDIWDGKNGEEDPRGYLLSYFTELKKYVAQVAQRGHGLVLVLT